MQGTRVWSLVGGTKIPHVAWCSQKKRRGGTIVLVHEKLASLPLKDHLDGGHTSCLDWSWLTFSQSFTFIFLGICISVLLYKYWLSLLIRSCCILPSCLWSPYSSSQSLEARPTGPGGVDSDTQLKSNVRSGWPLEDSMERADEASSTLSLEVK